MHTATGRLSLLCLLLPLLWSTGSGQPCEERFTCNDCITVAGDTTPCEWCTDEGVEVRCQDSFGPRECGEMVLKPRSNITDSESPIEAVIPTQYTVELRPGDPLMLPINVTTVRNVPLDIYILFDLSTSLAEEFAAMRLVSSQLTDNLQDITSDVRVGFGGFIDKTIRPYSRRSLNGNECTAEELSGRTVCFNFRHYGPLTDNSTELNDRINTVVLAPNIDSPESGLDAMAQVALCSEKVGWRDNSIKIILHFTDDAFHFAGEGRYAGIMKPFEDVCKVDGNLADDGFEEYSGLENDYTSPGQLLSILVAESIIPVFVAVRSPTQDVGFYSVLRTHQALAALFNKRLGGAASAAELESSSDTNVLAQNLLETIDQQVLEILRRTSLAPENIGGLSFMVSASCPPGAMEEVLGDVESCVEVEVGNTTEFFLTLTLDNCEEFGNEVKNLRVTVFPVGSVTIQITPICECECGDTEVNSDRCSNNGNFSCGECVCEPGYCGLQCQFLLAEQMTCPSIDNEECSGRGTCRVCECVCDRNITDNGVGDIDDRLLRPGVSPVTFGDACECDFYECLDPTNVTDTVVCSGPDRGECCNAECRCLPNADGYFYRIKNLDDRRDCDCDPEEVVCRQSDSGEVCGGRGVCECKTCACNFPYTGTYCDEVIEGLDCNDVAIESEAQECILSEKDRGGRERDECQSCSLQSNIFLSCVSIIPEGEQPTSIEEMEVQSTIEDFAARELSGNIYEFVAQCSFFDDDECTHDYYILYNKGNSSEFIFVAEEQRTCPPTTSDPLLGIPLWALAAILIGVLLILGIIILVVIKAIFMLLDYFEVKRLEKEVGQADFSKNQNPLYQSPDVEYKNVAYGKE